MKTTYCVLPFKNKNDTVIDDSSNTKYNNLVLNQHCQNPIFSSPAKSFTIEKKNISCPDFVNTEVKNESHSWHKSDTKYQLLNKDYIKEKESGLNRKASSSKNGSTLSLHIAAYENLNEGNFGTCLSQHRMIKTGDEVKTWGICSISVIQNAFEFPRQQNNGNQIPEIMEFQRNQTLLDAKKKKSLNERKKELQQLKFLCHGGCSEFLQGCRITEHFLLTCPKSVFKNFKLPDYGVELLRSGRKITLEEILHDGTQLIKTDPYLSFGKPDSDFYMYFLNDFGKATETYKNIASQLNLMAIKRFRKDPATVILDDNNDYIKMIEKFLHNVDIESDETFKLKMMMLYCLIYYGVSKNADIREEEGHIHELLLTGCLRNVSAKMSFFLKAIEDIREYEDLEIWKKQNREILKKLVIFKKVPRILALLAEHCSAIASFQLFSGNSDVGNRYLFQKIYEHYKDSRQNPFLNYGCKLLIYGTQQTHEAKSVKIFEKLATFGEKELSNLGNHGFVPVCSLNGIAPNDLIDLNMNNLKSESLKDFFNRIQNLPSFKTMMLMTAPPLKYTLNPIYINKGPDLNSNKSNCVLSSEVKQNDALSTKDTPSISAAAKPSLKHPDALAQWIPLPNKNNSCFLNTAIQILNLCIPLKNSIISSSRNTTNMVHKLTADILAKNEGNVAKLRYELNRLSSLTLNGQEDANRALYEILQILDNESKSLLEMNQHTLINCKCERSPREMHSFCLTIELKIDPSDTHNTISSMCNYFLSSVTDTCNLCSALRIQERQVLIGEKQKFLFIEINSRYFEDGAWKIVTVDNNNIENGLELFGKKWKVVGGILYQPYGPQTGHYITYCRTKSDAWLVISDDVAHTVQSLPKDLKNFKTLVFELQPFVEETDTNAIFASVIYSTEAPNYTEGEGYCEFKGNEIKLMDLNYKILASKIMDELITAESLETENEYLLEAQECIYNIRIHHLLANNPFKKAYPEQRPLDGDNENDFDNGYDDGMDIDVNFSQSNDNNEFEEEETKYNSNDIQLDLTYLMSIAYSIQEYDHIDQLRSLEKIMVEYKSQLEEIRFYTTEDEYLTAISWIKDIELQTKNRLIELAGQPHSDVMEEDYGFFSRYDSEGVQKVWKNDTYLKVFEKYLKVEYSGTSCILCPFCLFFGTKSAFFEHINKFHGWGKGNAKCCCPICTCPLPLNKQKQDAHKQNCFKQNFRQGHIDVSKIIAQGGDIMARYKQYKRNVQKKKKKKK